MKSAPLPFVSSREAQEVRTFLQQYPQPPRKFSRQLMTLVMVRPSIVGLIIWMLLGCFFLDLTINDPNLGSRRQAAYVFSLGISTAFSAFTAIVALVDLVWTFRYGVYSWATIVDIRPKIKDRLYVVVDHFEVEMDVDLDGQIVRQSLTLIIRPLLTIRKGTICEVITHPKRGTIWRIFPPESLDRDADGNP